MKLGLVRDLVVFLKKGLDAGVLDGGWCAGRAKPIVTKNF